MIAVCINRGSNYLCEPLKNKIAGKTAHQIAERKKCPYRVGPPPSPLLHTPTLTHIQSHPPNYGKP